MAKMKIVKGEETKILRTVCAGVKKFDSGLKRLVQGMKEAMFGADGLGIAAPQVGVDARVFLVVLGYKSKNSKVVAMVNPEIVEFSEEKTMHEEGCLSLPGVYGNVERAKSVKVRFMDVEGLRMEMNLEGLDARVVQHEMDHLNGVLFVDKVIEVKKRKIGDAA